MSTKIGSSIPRPVGNQPPVNNQGPVNNNQQGPQSRMPNYGAAVQFGTMQGRAMTQGNIPGAQGSNPPCSASPTTQPHS